jgi:hypothetical protein
MARSVKGSTWFYTFSLTSYLKPGNAAVEDKFAHGERGMTFGLPKPSPQEEWPEYHKDDQVAARGWYNYRKEGTMKRRMLHQYHPLWQVSPLIDWQT